MSNGSGWQQLVALQPGSPPAGDYRLSFAPNRLRPAFVSRTLCNPFSSSHPFSSASLTARSTSSWSRRTRRRAIECSMAHRPAWPPVKAQTSRTMRRAEVSSREAIPTLCSTYGPETRKRPSGVDDRFCFCELFATLRATQSQQSSAGVRRLTRATSRAAIAGVRPQAPARRGCFGLVARAVLPLVFPIRRSASATGFSPSSARKTVSVGMSPLATSTTNSESWSLAALDFLRLTMGRVSLSIPNTPSTGLRDAIR